MNARKSLMVSAILLLFKSAIAFCSFAVRLLAIPAWRLNELTLSIIFWIACTGVSVGVGVGVASPGQSVGTLVRKGVKFTSPRTASPDPDPMPDGPSEAPHQLF